MLSREVCEARFAARARLRRAEYCSAVMLDPLLGELVHAGGGATASQGGGAREPGEEHKRAAVCEPAARAESEASLALFAVSGARLRRDWCTGGEGKLSAPAAGLPGASLWSLCPM